MSKFYTSVNCVGNNILYRGVENGRRIKEKIPYTPTLFLPAKKQTKFKTLKGDYLEPMKFESIRDARDFVKRYEGVDSFEIYGNNRYEYVYISDEHPEETIEWNVQDVCVAYLDIEVGSENGFPEPSLASEPVTAITVKLSNDPKFYVFACGDFKPHRDDIIYTQCRDELSLLSRFIEFWQKHYPDALTGWNVKNFDIPYLHNRIERLYDEKEVKKLSPWGLISVREETFYGKTTKIYDLVGLPTLDYLQLFRKYAPNSSQESYRLDHIAQVEKVGQKISYDEYDSLQALYRENFQLFIEYNIRDVELVENLNAKGRLIDMALTLAYDNKVNYDDVFTQVRMWDTITFNHLRAKNIIVPPKRISSKNTAYEGAYVKDPHLGKHEYVASFDLNSLYPHLIMQYNISPETLVEPRDYTPEMREIIAQGVTVDKLLTCQIDTSRLKNVTLTPNGQFFRTDIKGFLPDIMERIYNGRVIYKKSMIEAQQKYEVETNLEIKKELSNHISRYKNLQLAKKVGLNSAYGALGSQYFRFFDVRQAEGITLAGQLSIRWIENHINQYMNNLLKTNEVDYVLASDTDSIYLNLGPLVDKVYSKTGDVNNLISFMDRVCEDKLQPSIDESYQKLADYVHAYEQKMQMKREVLADKAIWTAKKRYILHVHNSEGVQYAEPQIKIQGLEAIKSSTPSACREKIKEALKIIIGGTEEQLQSFIENFRKEFKSIPIEDISFPRTVNGLKEYANEKTVYSKGTPIHVRGALIHNNRLRADKLTKRYELIREGEKIKFIFLREPNTFQSNVLSFASRMPSEWNMTTVIDYDMQFEKSFIEPLTIVLDCIGWRPIKESSLEDFFG
jgi:DNA polymerase elongation subunit (family B)